MRVWGEREEDGEKIISIMQKAQETGSAKKGQEDYHRFVSHKKPEKEQTITIVRPWNVTMLSSVGYVLNHTRGISLQRTSVSSVGYSYPCPELL